MSDTEHKMKFGMQIQTGTEDGQGAILISLTEEDGGDLDVVCNAMGFETSQQGAESIRDLFRSMADAIDAELGNTDAPSVRSTFNPKPNLQHVQDSIDNGELSAEQEAEVVARHGLSPRKPKAFNPTPRKENPRKPMGLAKQREKKRNHD